jgi:outer membrane protein
MNKHFLFIRRIILLICTLGIYSLYGQNSNATAIVTNAKDSISLSKIISTVIQNHPTVKEGVEAISSAADAISLAKTSYYPYADATANYTRLGPVTSITIPMGGSFDLFPADNYSAAVNVMENIYDFGKTKKNVALAGESKTLATLSLEQVKQKLAITTIAYYYSLLYLQEAIKINKEEQKTLQEHLTFIQKKKETGSATQYEILSTKVKISASENIGIELKSSLNNQIAKLYTLMGLKVDTTLTVKKEIEIRSQDKSSDSLLSYALLHRDEMLVALEKTNIAELKYKIVKIANNPSLNLYASGGAKNGYLPDLYKVTPNFNAGVGLKIPLFDGMRSKYNLLIAQNTINTTNDETDLARQTVTSDVLESLQNLKSSQKKVDHYTLQLSQAEEAFALAQTNYTAGSITNLDLLDAATIVSESRLLLYKSKVDYMLNIYKLKTAIGARLY